MMISDDVRDELHQQLLADRQRLEKEIANLSTSGVRGDTFQDDEGMDTADQHPADQGTELFEREKNLALQATLRDSLQAVNAALQRFDAGTYGICENCGKPIGEKRLRAMPSATLCIDCQSKLEKAAQAAQRAG